MRLDGNEFNRRFYLSWIEPHISNDHLKTLIKTHLNSSKYLAGVAFNNHQIPLAVELLNKSGILTIGTVACPLGGLPLALKVAQIIALDQLGADQIDIVLQMEAILENDFQRVEKELSNINQISTQKRLCAIINAPWLNKGQLTKVVSLIKNVKRLIVRTSTGYGIKTELNLVKDMRSLFGSKPEIIVSGGCETTEMALNFIEAGANGFYVDDIFPFIDGLQTLAQFQNSLKESN